MTLNDVSTYFLMIELFDGGECGLLPSLEPINTADIIKTLNARHDLDLGNNKEQWAKWFLGNADAATELERVNFLIFLRSFPDFRSKSD